MCLFLGLITEIHFRRKVEYASCRNSIHIPLLISQFRILRSKSHPSRQTPRFTIYTESYTCIMIILLIFRIFTLLRIKPLRLVLRELIRQAIRQYPPERHIVGRIITFAITILKTIAKLQIYSICQWFAITYFCTQCIIVSRSRNVTTNGIFIESRYTITTIIAGQVSRKTITFTIAIATNQTKSNITAAIIQLTGKLHIAISRQRITFR